MISLTYGLEAVALTIFVGDAVFFSIYVLWTLLIDEKPRTIVKVFYLKPKTVFLE